MKKVLSIILILIFSFSFAACKNSEVNQNGNDETGEFLMKITVGTKKFTAVLYDNETAAELIKMLPMSVNMNEHGGFEKYFNLSDNLPTDTYKPETIN